MSGDQQNTGSSGGRKAAKAGRLVAKHLLRRYGIDEEDVQRGFREARDLANSDPRLDKLRAALAKLPPSAFGEGEEDDLPAELAGFDVALLCDELLHEVAGPCALAVCEATRVAGHEIVRAIFTTAGMEERAFDIVLRPGEHESGLRELLAGGEVEGHG